MHCLPPVSWPWHPGDGVIVPISQVRAFSEQSTDLSQKTEDCSVRQGYLVPGAHAFPVVLMGSLHASRGPLGKGRVSSRTERLGMEGKTTSLCQVTV